jgi:hypothetical protein
MLIFFLWTFCPLYAHLSSLHLSVSFTNFCPSTMSLYPLKNNETSKNYSFVTFSNQILCYVITNTAQYGLSISSHTRLDDILNRCEIQHRTGPSVLFMLICLLYISLFLLQTSVPLRGLCTLWKQRNKQKLFLCYFFQSDFVLSSWTIFLFCKNVFCWKLQGLLQSISYKLFSRIMMV